MDKKGLIVYDSIYASTNEVSYWLKALIGEEQHVEVKHVDQVLTVEPYDYVIIGSYTRWEKASKKVYGFVKEHYPVLKQKQVAYFLTCGDTDETMVLKAPGQKAHLIAGRNYVMDLVDTYPDISPVAVGGFGGRECLPKLNRLDSFQVWLVGKLAKESSPWEGLEIWESLVPERVEIFANEIREKILGLPPRTDGQNLRWYWNSLQPANKKDLRKEKYTPKAYTEHHSTNKIYFVRFRIKGSLDESISLIQQWARESSIDLQEQKSTFFNTYYHAVKAYNGKSLTVHIVVSTMAEDPGNVHVSFRSWDKPGDRKGAEEDIGKAENLLCADGRKVD